MQQRFEGISIDVAQSGTQPVGMVGPCTQRLYSVLIEGMDCIARRLFIATESKSNTGSTLQPCRSQQDLTAAKHKGIRGTEPCFEAFLFFFRQRAYKKGRFHAGEYITFPIIPLEFALEISQRDWKPVSEEAPRCLVCETRLHKRGKQTRSLQGRGEKKFV